ncbi:unnamed protein product [Prorocentrum cordatum]|uniref:Pentatricopeptide repeat-containing protein, chloroplastic n=1 Tax=Prorocentrum cordatum TaxID=2364126 RepID=A0ABN9UFH9_9DINO|nr:unnamed protein product [Polarella glacialis]
MQGGSACQQESGSHGSISYSAGISACEKGKQWQRALALLSEMWAAKLEPDVIFSYSAGISACEKGEEWQLALALLSEMWEAKLEQCWAQLQRWDQRVREGRAVAVGAGAAERDVGSEGGAQRRQLQRWDQRVRERQAVAAGAGAAERDAGGEAGARRIQLQCWDQRVREGQAVAAGAGAAERDEGDEAGTRLSYSAGISACENGEQWQLALALLSEMRAAKLEPNDISYSAGISACEKGEQWQWALALLSEMSEVKVEPTVISHLLCCDQRVREGRALAAGAGAAKRDAGDEAGAQRPQLQRWDQRVREGRAVAAGAGTTERDVRSEAGVQRHLSYMAGRSACQNQLQR